ncbi:MAG: DUF1799 domain-containing protein [Amphiplicatus sp.]
MDRERHGRSETKKLADAVAFWAQGATASTTDNSEALEDARLLGLPQEAIDELQRQEVKEPEVFDLWEENDPPLRWFFALSTQWRVSPLGEPIGLDYPAAESVGRMMGLDVAALFGELRHAERAALKYWREHRPKPPRRPRRRR